MWFQRGQKSRRKLLCFCCFVIFKLNDRYIQAFFSLDYNFLLQRDFETKKTDKKRIKKGLQFWVTTGLPTVLDSEFSAGNAGVLCFSCFCAGNSGIKLVFQVRSLLYKVIMCIILLFSVILEILNLSIQWQYF